MDDDTKMKFPEVPLLCFYVNKVYVLGLQDIPIGHS